VHRVAIEAAHPMSWYRWVGQDGVVISIETVGAPAACAQFHAQCAITAARVLAAATALLRR
jgi:transketolase